MARLPSWLTLVGREKKSNGNVYMTFRINYWHWRAWKLLIVAYAQWLWHKLTH